METAGRLRLADVFVSIQDPRQAAKVEHDLVDLLAVAVNAVLVGADTFVEIELWTREKLEWLRGYLRLTDGIPSRDTFGRMFGLIDAKQFEAAFRRWVSSILPALGAEIVAIDGKTSRRSGGVGATAIQDRGADYVLAVKDNQPKLAESIEDFWHSFRAHPVVHTPHSFAQTVEKDRGRLETRRCYVFD